MFTYIVQYNFYTPQPPLPLISSQFELECYLFIIGHTWIFSLFANFDKN